MPNKDELQQFSADHALFNSAMTTVKDQSRIGSCTANSLAGAYEYLFKKSAGSNIDVSRLFIYYNARALNAQMYGIANTGYSMTDAIAALEQYGTCFELIWPYKISYVNVQPSEATYEQA
ncbi:unnamed protein product [Rotaria magnacalcarata]|uniref:Peptidase C1A papain C-terminal domain-containing protein n=1 Tax=Rotaria magnacalcarata TaxID=392030 RepID=A0A816XYX3_9BILA|nr:unnamed protein product [Rotaria magnacalcarata]CAF4090699.1 unnamed protein product [Rotaria magnacalcarata]